MKLFNNLLISNNIPIEIIDYIYQFDDTHKNNYNDCLKELNLHLFEYNEKFDFCKRVVMNSISGDEAFYSYSNDCFEWATRYGLNYNQSSYLLNKSLIK